jgi:hypothetical protein
MILLDLRCECEQVWKRGEDMIPCIYPHVVLYLFFSLLDIPADFPIFPSI